MQVITKFKELPAPPPKKPIESFIVILSFIGIILILIFALLTYSLVNTKQQILTESMDNISNISLSSNRTLHILMTYLDIFSNLYSEEQIQDYQQEVIREEIIRSIDEEEMRLKQEQEHEASIIHWIIKAVEKYIFQYQPVFTNWISRNPTLQNAYLLERQKDFSRAIEYYQKVEEELNHSTLYPEDRIEALWFIKLHIGYCYARLFQLDTTIEIYKRLKTEPTTNQEMRDTLEELISILIHFNNLNKEIEESVSDPLVKGISFYKIANYERAIQELMQADEEDPAYMAQKYFYLARIYENMKNFEEAVNYYQQSLQNAEEDKYKVLIIHRYLLLDRYYRVENTQVQSLLEDKDNQDLVYQAQENLLTLIQDREDDTLNPAIYEEIANISTHYTELREQIQLQATSKELHLASVAGNSFESELISHIQNYIASPSQAAASTDNSISLETAEPRRNQPPFVRNPINNQNVPSPSNEEITLDDAEEIQPLSTAQGMHSMDPAIGSGENDMNLDYAGNSSYQVLTLPRYQDPPRDIERRPPPIQIITDDDQTYTTENYNIMEGDDRQWFEIQNENGDNIIINSQDITIINRIRE